MVASVVIAGLCLMLIGLLFETDAHIGPVAVEATERQLEDPLQSIDHKEQDPEALQLLKGMSCLVALIHLGEAIPVVGAYEQERPNRHRLEPLWGKMVAIDLLHIIIIHNT